MNKIIEWCNLNSGFTSALLSFIGLLISLIAIIVSISTARLPYKKKIKLSASYSFLIYDNEIGQTGISVEAVNIGGMPVTIKYLGFGMKNGSSFQKFYPIQRPINANFVLKPSELNSNVFYANEIQSLLSKNKSKYLYSIAIDSAEKVYMKKFKKAKEILTQIK